METSTTMDIIRRLELLANQCDVSEHECLVRAEKLHEQARNLTIESSLYDADSAELSSAKQIMADEHKRLMAQAAKEEAEAKKFQVRSYARRGLLYLGPDELNDPDVYEPGLHDAAIAAGVAFITSDRVGPLGESEDDDAV
jgi:hypothetical protein